MESTQSKLYSDDVSLVMVLIDTNPHFWSSIPTTIDASDNPPSAITNSSVFSLFLSHVLPFLNSILLLNQLNQVVVIATGAHSYNYIFDSSSPTDVISAAAKRQNKNAGSLSAHSSTILQKLEEFVAEDRRLAKSDVAASGKVHSLVSGSLSLALCCILFVCGGCVSWILLLCVFVCSGYLV